jgi:hypothetical protein
MDPDFLNEIEELIAKKHKVYVGADVRYKILDRDDDDYQGLYKEAKTISISRRGMTLLMKQRVKPEDAMLIELFLGTDGRKIKACCESIGCRKESFNLGYEVEIQYIILKENDKNYIDEYIEKMSLLP